MENQTETEYKARPTPLRGYRELTEAELELVDRIKQAEQQVGALWYDVSRNLGADVRSVAHSKTNLQDGFMWLVRAVTKPRDVFGPISSDGDSE